MLPVDSNSRSSSSPSAQSRSKMSQQVMDKYYGQRDMAELCEYVIISLFAVAPPSSSSHLPTPPSSPSSRDSKVREPPPLVEYIAYALYRTRLPTSIIYQSLLLLNRLKARYPSARGTSSSHHRLFLSSLMLSSKISMDDTYSNKSWAIVGSNYFALKEVNQMERELFAFLDWNVIVRPEELEEYTARIDAEFAEAKRIAGRTALLRQQQHIAQLVDSERKRRRSSGSRTSADAKAAQDARHKRAADAAMALLRPAAAAAATATTASSSSRVVSSDDSDTPSFSASSSSSASPMSPVSPATPASMEPYTPERVAIQHADKYRTAASWAQPQTKDVSAYGVFVPHQVASVRVEVPATGSW